MCGRSPCHAARRSSLPPEPRLNDSGDARSLERRMHRTRTTGRTRGLRQLLLQPELSFLMEAHNGISAKIVEEAGFDGIWASGLTMSASCGVRDNNELSWTQVA